MARSKNQPVPGMSFWARIPAGVYFLVGGLAILGLGIGLPVYFGSRMSMRDSSASQPASAGQVGQPASAFTLRDAYGQPYTLAPGDGKNHLLVFYMGYF